MAGCVSSERTRLKYMMTEPPYSLSLLCCSCWDTFRAALATAIDRISSTVGEVDYRKVFNKP